MQTDDETCMRLACAETAELADAERHAALYAGIPEGCLLPVLLRKGRREREPENAEGYYFL